MNPRDEKTNQHPRRQSRAKGWFPPRQSRLSVRPRQAEKLSTHCAFCGSSLPWAGGRCLRCVVAPGDLCAGCGIANLSTARYCGNCGKALPVGARLSELPNAALLGVERRYITVMFCDLVGSATLVNTMDAEDYAAIIRKFHLCITHVVEQAGGFLAQYLGDGALIYFGYPQAEENDTERAIRAALDMVAAVEQVHVGVGLKLHARVGVSVGDVVSGEIIGVGGPRALGLAGEAPNLAARLQAIAEPGSVVVDARVLRLTGGLFEYRSIGLRELKGWHTAMHVWQILRPVPQVDQFEARTYAARSPLIGRTTEVDMLRTLWQRACDGHGKTVIVSGEPGIGKSRLAAELLDDIAGSNHTRIRYYCNAQQKGNVLAPCILTLELQSYFESNDTPTERVEKLRLALPDATPYEFCLITDLLMLPSAPESVLQISPQLRRTQTIDALLGPLRAMSRRHPVLVLFEDAHWSDPATLELLSTATRDIDQYPIMMVITARPEFRPSWEIHPNVETIIVDPMSIVESRNLIGWVAAERPLSRTIVQDIIKRSDGVPLFIEEVTRAAIDFADTVDVASAVHSPLPLTLHGSLLARLDRLGSARDVAKIAAVIGRDFGNELLASVTGLTDAELRPLVGQLLKSGLVLGGTPDHRRFRFKHALIQDAAYGSIVRSERVGLHARIAVALEADFPDLATAEPQLLAHHFTEAGFLEKAVIWWLRAGVQSLMRSAALEALEPLDRGLKINASLPDDAARMRQELELTIAYAKALIATQGHASARTGAAFARAHELCRALGDPPHFLTILHGEWTHVFFRADLPQADRQAREILKLSEDQDDPSWSLIGCYCVGVTALPLGNFQDVVIYLERGLREAALHRSAYAGPVVPDPAIVMRTYLSWALMNLGRFGAARREARQAVAEARKLGQMLTLAFTLWHAAYVTLLTVSVRDGLAALQRLQALAAQHGIVFYETVAQIFSGWAIGMEGDPEQGLALMRQGLAAHRLTGNLIYVPSYMRLEAEILGRAGRSEEGLAVLADAEPLARAASALFDDSEFARTRAELLWRGGQEAAAEAAFRHAIALANARSATSFALRAALPFARMLAGQQRGAEAVKVLAPICARLRGSGAANEITEARILIREFQRVGVAV